MNFDRVITNVKVIRHDSADPIDADIAIAGGKIVEVAPGIDTSGATEIIDGKGRLAFPGVVDAHEHWGIYNPLAEDAATESRACAQGGVTSAITYIRTGQYYLNKGGPYSEFMPDVLSACDGRSYVDYAFHLAPMMSSHIDEIPEIISRDGVTSFKIFMFYLYTKVFK